MRSFDLPHSRLILLPILLFSFSLAAWPQTANSPSRILGRVDENALVTLRGNTHPLAQLQFDQGAAPLNLPLARMLLVLKRGDAQEAALQSLLDAQQDQNSLSYHQWLTPDAFGQQFGPSDQDIQTVAAWLASHGFQLAPLSRGRTVLEFSGTAAQVQQAFHTEIHKYLVNGEEHWANASDPQIPAALAPVVSGINSLHNFPKQPMYRLATTNSSASGMLQARSLSRDFTFNDSRCGGLNNCYFLGPYDFAAIYNVLPLWSAGIDGTGQSIGILNESNINIQDVLDFRSIFNLPANDTQIVLNGPDPGLVTGVETEADLDVEWSGAVAPGATIKLVVSASTDATAGVDLSAVFAVENNVAPVLSESFGECELFLGNAGNAFQNGIRQQAAAQGITFINSSGDEGSARCDVSKGSPPEPAAHGLAVSGLASSPYGVAVGGTDFLNFGSSYNLNAPSPYWNAGNDPQHQVSAAGYVPETTWNDTCTNEVYVFVKAGANAEAACNNPQISNDVFTVAGGGGKSACTSSDGSTPASCSGGYAKPPWQSAPGVPSDNARFIPDVSLFAGNGFMDSAYILCQSDKTNFGTCNLNSLQGTYLGIGGTSASAPAFAGIMALVNQFTGAAGQGNANYELYKMASSSAQTSQSCGATSSPSSNCIFHDVTKGSNEVPCTKGSPNCNTSDGADTYGVLSGYSATSGYDQATGLGSVNAYNLVHNWTKPTIPSSTTLSLNGGAQVNITHGQNVNFTISVTPSAATGTVSLMGSPSGSGFIPFASFPLVNGSASGSTAALAGGTSYSVKAYYPGTSTYVPSDSLPMTVTVAPEPSKTLFTLPTFDPTTGRETGNTPTSIVYGTSLAARADVGNSQASQTFPEQVVCVPLSCPTGTVTFTDSWDGTAPYIFGTLSGFALNAYGFVQDNSAIPTFNGGTHQLTATYSGDDSYKTSAATYSFLVTPAPTRMGGPASSPCFPCLVGVPIQLSAIVSATSSFVSAAPSGQITFYDGTTPISGTILNIGNSGSTTNSANLTTLLTTSFATSGVHQISAKYSGDGNYGPAMASAVNITLVFGTSIEISSNSAAVNLGQSVNITATVTGLSKTPAMTGTIVFSAMIGSVTPTAGTDSNGNQTLTATAAVTPQATEDIQVNYLGDSNYAAAESEVFVNVNIPDFSINIPANPFLVTDGQPGSYPMTIAPVSSLSSAVNISCGGNLPVGYTCGASPAIVNLSGGSTGSFMLTLTPITSGATNAANRVAFATHFPKSPLSSGGFVAVSFLVGLASLVFFAASRRPIHWRVASRLVLISSLNLALGCGGGSAGNGGGGGGMQQPTPTTTTVITSAAKVASQAPFTLTATVIGSQTPSGGIQFFGNGLFLGSAFLVGGSASLSASIVAPGIFNVTAQYVGDTLNNPSTSPAINQAITGTTTLSVQGQTSTTIHSANVNITIQ
jgi:hypothetical protein